MNCRSAVLERYFKTETFKTFGFETVSIKTFIHNNYSTGSKLKSFILEKLRIRIVKCIKTALFKEQTLLLILISIFSCYALLVNMEKNYLQIFWLEFPIINERNGVLKEAEPKLS